jgi:hypothetical protein
MSNKIKKSSVPFSMIANELLNSKEISLKSKGLYGFMFSKPENWNFTIKSMSKQLKDGAASISSGLDELKKYGWVIYEKHKDGTGTYHLLSEPKLGNQVLGNKSQNSETPPWGNPTLGKPSSINNIDDINNTDLTNKKDSSDQNFEKTLFPELDDTKEVLFKDTSLIDYNVFVNQMKELDQLGIDLYFYWSAVKDWSTTKKKVKRTAQGWVATARGFIRRDKQASKLQMKNGTNTVTDDDAEMLKFLNR